ncbi:MAG: protease complex subunit PrcB family protein [Gammaproteobacteria bacterium]|nr:MAG: protease complex subunit PrcB family protein [Gammaproteobacteria bacterium]
MMTHPKAALLAVFFGGALLGGCAATAKTETASGAPLARQIAQSAHCGLVAPGHLLIRNEAELAQLSSLPGRNLSLAPFRQIDFRQETLVLVAQGQKPTGGYAITLEESAILDEELVLTVSERSPEPGSMVTQALTTPCAAIAVTAEGWNDIRITHRENNR